MSLMKVLTDVTNEGIDFSRYVFYMEHIIFLGIIANRSFSLLSRLYRSYDAYAMSN